MAMEAEVADLLGLRVAFLDTEGEKPGPVSALFGPESYVRASAAAIDIAGMSGLLDWTDPEAPVDGSLDCALSQRGRDDDLRRFQRSAPQLDRREPAWPAPQPSTAVTWIVSAELAGQPIRAVTRGALTTAQSANISKPCTAPA